MWYIKFICMLLLELKRESYLVSHAATSDFDQSLEILDACDHLRFCDWQFSSYFSGSSHSTSCSSLALQVNCALSAWQKLIKQIIRNIVRFKVVLTCVLCHICVTVRLLGMHVQIKRLYAFLACIYDENSHTCPTRTRMKQSGLMLSRQIPSNKAAERFLGILDQNQTAVRFLGV